MRYVKVLLLVLLFFFVMLFFVQNQATFSQSLPLKLDLIFAGPFESQPLPFYTMLLVCFLLGAIVTLLMLMWDRVSISAKLTMSNMRARGFEKDLNRAKKQLDANENKAAELKTELDTLKIQLKDAENRAKVAERTGM